MSCKDKCPVSCGVQCVYRSSRKANMASLLHYHRPPRRQVLQPRPPHMVHLLGEITRFSSSVKLST